MARITPVGKVSLNARFSMGVPLPVVMVNVSVLTLPGPIVSRLNISENVGWA